MAKVRQRTWTIPGQRTKRKAWGYVTINEHGKQVRCFKAEWTKEAAEDALAAYLLQVEQPKARTAGSTFEEAVERYAKGEGPQEVHQGRRAAPEGAQGLLRRRHAPGRHHQLAHQCLEG